MPKYPPGTTLDFKVTGKMLTGDTVKIGCRTFPLSEVLEVATDLVAETPKPAYQKGDVYLGAANQPRVRDYEGRWHGTAGVQAYSDEKAESLVAENPGYRFIVVGGKPVGS